MINQRFSRLSILAGLALTAVLPSGCGGGGGGGSSRGGQLPPPSSTMITGFVAGAASGVSVDAYRIDPATGDLTLQSSAAVGSDGSWSLAVGTGSPTLFVTNGGSLRDPATTGTFTFASGPLADLDAARARRLSALLGSGAGAMRTMALSSLTTIATERAVAIARTNSARWAEPEVAKVFRDIGREFGLTDLSGNGLDPRDVRALDLSDTADAAAAQADTSAPPVVLAMILAGLSEQGRTLGVAHPLDFVAALARDLRDGLLDGRGPDASGVSEPVPVAGMILAATAGTTDLSAAAQSFLGGGNNASGTSAADYTQPLAAIDTVDLTPVGNRTPSFNAIGAATFNEDDMSATIPLSGVTTGTSVEDMIQSLSFQITSSNTNVLEASGATVTGTGANRTLRLTFKADASGMTMVSLLAMDNGGTINGGVDTFRRTFPLTVTPVNDAPSFDPLAGVTVTSDGTTQTLTLGGVQAGAPDEINQTLTFSVQSSNTAIIPTPTITGSGVTRTLSYTPVMNSAGSVQLTVTLMDGGGTANGGQDTLTRTVTIQVVSPGGGTPAISTVLPAAARVTGGTEIAVNTTSFADFTVTAPTVTIGGQSVTPANLGVASFTFTVPPGLATGAQALVVSQGNDSDTFPGFMIVDPAAPTDLIVNEFFADPGGTSGTVDANGDGMPDTADDEYVELVNIRATALDITGFTLLDAFGARHVFPNPTTIPAGGAIVVFGGGTPTGFAPLHSNGAAQTASTGQLGLNNGGDDITINDDQGSLITMASYTATATDMVSANRATDADGSTAFVDHDQATLSGGGAAVGTTSPGVRVDGTPHQGGTTGGTMNTPPSFDTVPAQTTNEDTALMVMITNVDANDAGQTVSFTATSSDQTLVPNASLAFSGAGATRTLLVTPATDANGTATITLVATDSGTGMNTTTGTFDITVTAVNDAPSVDAVAPLTVTSDGAAKTISLTGLANGPADESAQTLTVTAASSDTAIIPAVAVSGSGATRTLTYTPVMGTSGPVTLTVTLMDDGGTANSGVDTATETITVTVNAPGAPAAVDTLVPQVARSTGGTDIAVTTTGFADFTTTAPTATLGGMSATLGNLTAAGFTLTVPAGLTAGAQTLVVSQGATTASFMSFTIVDPAASGDLIINEFMADPSAAVDTNGDGAMSSTEDEFVELVNTRTTALDISGFALLDAVQTRHTFPNPTTIPAGGAIVIFGGGTPTGFAALHMNGAAQAASGNQLGLNNGGDSITINDAQGSQITTASYTSATAMVSSNRATDADGAAAFVDHDQAVLSGGGAAVGDFSPGVRVDGSPHQGGVVGAPNNPPSFDTVPAQTSNEDAALMVMIMNVDANDAGQTVSFTATSSDQTLVLDANLMITGTGATRTLTVTPEADANGMATITLVATDSGSGTNTAMGTFDLTVTAVNDAPTVDAVAPLNVTSDGMAKTISLTGVGNGPADESGQTLTVTATSSDMAIIPSVTVSGSGATRTLTYTPVMGSSGPVTLTVTLTDSGGTANGGADTATATIMVTVMAPGAPAAVDTVAPQVARTSGGTAIAVTTTGFTDFTTTAPTATLGGMSATLGNLTTAGFTLTVPAGLTTGAQTLVVTQGATTASFMGFTMVDPAASGDLIINEFMADPSAAVDTNGDGTMSSTEDEFVELVNTRTTALDISGFALLDGNGSRHVFPNPTTIPAGGAIVVFGGGLPTGFAALHMNGAAQAASSNQLGLNNGGDSITINDAQGSQITTASYSSATAMVSSNRATDADGAAAFVDHDQALLPGGGAAVGTFSPGVRVDGSPHQGGTAPSNAAIDMVVPSVASASGGTLITVTTSGYLADFTTTAPTVTIGGQSATVSMTPSANVVVVSAPAASAGTGDVVVTAGPESATQPGFQIVDPATTGDLLINEVFPNPGTAADTNGDGAFSSTDDEFVELVNLRMTPLDLSGLELSDGNSLRHTFPNPTTVPAGGAIVVFGGGSPAGFMPLHANGAAQAASSGDLGLNNGGDTVTVVLGATTIADATFGSVTTGVSLNRQVDGDSSAAFIAHGAAGTAAGMNNAVGDFSPGVRVDGSPHNGALTSTGSAGTLAVTDVSASVVASLQSNGALQNVSTVGLKGLQNVTAMTLDTQNNRLLAVDGTLDLLVAIDPATFSIIGVGATGLNGISGLTYDSAMNRTLACDNSTNSLVELDSGTGQGTIIGSFGTGLTDPVGLAFVGGTLFAIDSDVANSSSANDITQLLTVDPATGSATVVGTISTANEQHGGLVYDSAGDKLYTVNQATGALLELNRTTGAATVVGTTTGFFTLNALAIDASGNLRGYDDTVDSLIGIDKATGVGTRLRSLGFRQVKAMTSDGTFLYALDGLNQLLVITGTNGTVLTVAGTVNVNDLEGLARDPATGTIYAIASDGVGSLYTINVGTATATIVGSAGSVGFAAIRGLAWDAMQSRLLGYDQATDSLVAIDPTTAVGSSLGAVGRGQIEGLTMTPGGVLYATDTTNNELLTLAPATGAPTTVGSTGFLNLRGLAFDSIAGSLFACDTRSELATLDTSTGAASAVGSLGFDDVTGLAFDTTTLRLYGTDTGSGSTRLLVIDGTTGSATFIGRLGAGFDSTEGLAFDRTTNTLYGIDTTGSVNRLVTIDPSTGQATLVGTDTGIGGDITGLAFDTATNTLYGVNAVGGNDTLVSIDTGTGVGMTLFTLTGFSSVEGLGYDSGTATLYGINQSTNAPAQVFAIDVAGQSTTALPASAALLGARGLTVVQ